MQLCRFVLREEPDGVRSGLFHDGRFFETDGEQAVGVHEISKVLLLPPMQTIASLRVFDDTLAYQYRNSAVFGGALTEFDAPAREVSPEIRIAAVLKDSGEMIDAEEAETFILGYSLFFSIATLETDDFPFAIGPFLTIPEGTPVEVLNHPVMLKVNGETVLTNPPYLPDFPAMIERASRTNRTTASDVIVTPSLVNQPHALHPGDSVQVVHEGLGTLSIRVV